MSKRKRVFKKIYIALFVAMISLPWFIWAGVRIFAPEYYAEQSDVSKEKRNKNEFDFKALFKSGENLSLYVDDRVPFRGGMIEAYQSAEGKTEKVYQDFMRGLMKFFSVKPSEQKTVDVGNIDSMFDDVSADVTANDVSSEPEAVSSDDGADHEHVLTEIERVDPDCNNGGYVLYKCDNCDYTYREELEPAHNYVLIKESVASYEEYGYKLFQCDKCGKLMMSDFESKYVDTTYMAPQNVGGTMIGRFNWLFYAGQNFMDFYTGANILPESEMAKYAEKVNRLKELCDARGIVPMIMFMPNKEQVYSEYLPTMEVLDEYKRTKRLTDYINQYTQVACFYPVEELKAADVYWQVYYKYDSHWNHMGAYVGLSAYYKNIGVETYNPWLLGPYSVPVTREDLITLGGLSRDNYPPETEIMPNYRPNIRVEGLSPLADICHTYAQDAPYDSKIVVLSDSYREMMTPFIAKDFREMVAAHRDFTDQCADDIKTCQFLFLTAVERDDVQVFKCIDKVISILEQP